jgi:ubiquitin C-terminal hydrolase
MSNYIYLDETDAPIPYGLNNTGAICYFNSLLQCLLSATAISSMLLKLGHFPQNMFGTPINEFLKLSHGNNPFQSAAVLQALLRWMNSEKKPAQNFIGQASTSEGLIYLMEALHVDNIIMHRQLRYVTCGLCRRKGESRREESIHVELFDHDVGKINSPEQFAAYLMKRTTKLPDFKCDHCEQSNANTTQTELLTMVSEIIVVLFNKYSETIGTNYAAIPKSNVMYCPEHFTLPGDTPLEYVQVGQARHAGSLTGGHYWAVVRRNGVYYTANDMQIQPCELDQSSTTYMVVYALRKST